MPVQFQVESVIRKPKPSYIIARHLTPGQYFSVERKSFLNNIEIKPVLTSPSAAYENGEPRFDLFIFHLAKSSDIEKFEKGMIVELRNEFVD
jgi:hypothetical protein